MNAPAIRRSESVSYHIAVSRIAVVAQEL